MAQTYPDIPATKAVRDSRQDILDRDEAVRSAFSGTTFPSANLVVGMFCFRTDLGQIYELTATSPVTWTRIPLGVPVPLAQGGTGASDAATARANLGLAALAVKNTVAAGDIDNAAVQTAKLQDASVTTAKIADGQVTTAKLADGQVTTAKLGDAQVTTAKIGDQQIATAKLADAAVTNAKIADGAVTSGKVADSSITSAKIADGTIATADLAAQTIADIRNGVDLGSRVAKTGDSMSGELAGTTFRSNGTSGSSTGFRLANATDIGNLFAAASNAFTGASGSGGGYGSSPKVTSVSLSRSGTTAVLSVGTACDCDCACNC
jgi:hypothetical protein